MFERTSEAQCAVFCICMWKETEEVVDGGDLLALQEFIEMVKKKYLIIDKERS